MGRGFFSGITTGAVIGAAVGFMVMPQLDKDTRRKIKKFDRAVMDMAAGMYDSVRRYNRHS